jgi:hypothetical protein
LTSYNWRRLWEPHFPEFWHERGLFPSFQAPPSTVSLGTRASKHPIKQPPQPLDRSSLNLQKPERSSSLDPPRALTRLWYARLGSPRATMSGRATTFSEIGVPGICLDQDHHQRIDRLPIYRCTVEKTPSEKWNAPPTRQRRNRRRFSRALAPPHWFEAQNTSFQAPKRWTGSPFGLLSGRSTIWRWNHLHRRPHAPPRTGEAPTTFSTSQHAPSSMCLAHAALDQHTPMPRVTSLCRRVSPYRLSARHVSMPRQKKKKKGKFG